MTMLYIKTAAELAAKRMPTWPSRHRDADLPHTAAAIPSKPPSTRSSSSTWRPISRSQGKTTGEVSCPPEKHRTRSIAVCDRLLIYGTTKSYTWLQEGPSGTAGTDGQRKLILEPLSHQCSTYCARPQRGRVSELTAHRGQFFRRYVRS